MAETKFGCFRIPQEMINTLNDYKSCYQVVYGKKFTNAELIQHLLDCVEEGDIAVHEMYSEMIYNRENS